MRRERFLRTLGFILEKDIVLVMEEVEVHVALEINVIVQIAGSIIEIISKIWIRAMGLHLKENDVKKDHLLSKTNGMNAWKYCNLGNV